MAISYLFKGFKEENMIARDVLIENLKRDIEWVFAKINGISTPIPTLPIDGASSPADLDWRRAGDKDYIKAAPILDKYRVLVLQNVGYLAPLICRSIEDDDETGLTIPLRIVYRGIEYNPRELALLIKKAIIDKIHDDFRSLELMDEEVDEKQIILAKTLAMLGGYK